MADSYLRQRRVYSSLSGVLVVAAATDDTVLGTVRSANYTIFVQKIHVQITTGSAKTWSFEDTANTPVSISGSLDVSTAPLHIDLDFGPDGIALTAGTNFNLNVSAAGAAGIVTWEGYQKLSSIVSLATVNTQN